jgi:phospholipid/cholesterol/gamma-HCH transport system ATP-binding protein
VGLVGADSGVINVWSLILPKMIPTNSMKYEFELFSFQKRSIIRFHERMRKFGIHIFSHMKLSSEEVENQIKEILENVGLSEAIDKMPSELSEVCVKEWFG